MAVLQRLTESMVVSAVALAVAAGVVVVATMRLVSGPWLLLPGASVLVAAQAVLLAVAVAAVTLVLGDADLAWRPDGMICLGLLIGLGAAVGAGWEDLVPVLRVVGGGLAPLSLVALLALVERRSRRTLRWTWWAAAVLGAPSTALLVVRDPFTDPRCWSDCSVLDGAPLPSSAAAAALALVLTLTGWTVASATCVLALASLRSERTGRQSDTAWSWLDRGIVASAAVAALGVAVVLTPSSRGTAASAAFAASAAQCALAVLATLQPVRAVHRRRRLQRLVLALGDLPPVGRLEATLGRLLGDRELRVAYWLPESRRYVDAAGEPTDAGEHSPSTLTLRRDDEPLAQVRLSRPVADVRDLRELIGSAALLAIDSERLEAGLRAQLTELRASRQRIVAAADGARRRVERSLHDIVQSELLGTLYELSLARSAAQRSGAVGEADEAARSADGVRELVVRLRNFAHGVYPAALDAAGLPAALDALADDAPTVLSLGCRLERRPPADVERASYLLIHDAVTRAERDLRVDIGWNEDDLVVEIDGYPGEVPADVEDRLGALDGALLVEAGWLRAVLPCG